MLAGPQVIEETAAAFAADAALPLRAPPARGDEGRRGRRRRQARQAIGRAADPRRGGVPALDLRVDDHADPLAELARLEEVSRERCVHFRKFMPTPARTRRA